MLIYQSEIVKFKSRPLELPVSVFRGTRNTLCVGALSWPTGYQMQLTCPTLWGKLFFAIISRFKGEQIIRDEFLIENITKQHHVYVYSIISTLQ